MLFTLIMNLAIPKQIATISLLKFSAWIQVERHEMTSHQLDNEFWIAQWLAFHLNFGQQHVGVIIELHEEMCGNWNQGRFGRIPCGSAEPMPSLLFLIFAINTPHGLLISFIPQTHACLKNFLLYSCSKALVVHQLHSKRKTPKIFISRSSLF